MKELDFKKISNWKAYLTITIIIVGLITIYFSYFFSYSCSDLACFYSHQEECVKTKFINDQEETTWKYFILGEENGKCEINVEVLVVKKGSINKQKLEGKDMNCYLPLGSIISPESDLSKCNGILKEEMQNLIIQQLHKYIVENVKDIGEELADLGLEETNLTQ